MPTIYLSPSTQENNFYVTGGTEEEYMNRIADAMEPYLRSSGIRFLRNTPDMTAASSIRASNAANVDLHVAIHSNAAPENRYGQVRGTDVYYAPTSANGRRAAEIFAANLKRIYPTPSLVRAIQTTALGEVTRTRAPAVLIELAYHDNVDDANWITSNISNIARNLVQSITEYFGLPFVEATPAREGRVSVRSGNLNIRSKPSLNASVIASAPKGAAITVLGRWRDWYVVDYNGTIGYAAAQFITV